MQQGGANDVRNGFLGGFWLFFWDYVWIFYCFCAKMVHGLRSLVKIRQHIRLNPNQLQTTYTILQPKNNRYHKHPMLVIFISQSTYHSNAKHSLILSLFKNNNNKNVEMQQQSSNNSEHSNFFALSSESSRLSNTHKRKKQHYSAFINKVKDLLQADNDDLDQLYRKVEIIVKKYFNEHKIVEFSDMYEHIASLRSNSGKMMVVVGLLQRKFNKEHRQYQDEVIEQKSTSRREHQTQTNSKQIQIISKIKQQKGDDRLKQFKESVGDVVTSMQQHQRPTHSFHKSEAMTTNISDDLNNHFRRDKNSNKREESPSRYSPDRLNSSFEEYQIRNKQYEQKVRELLTELNEIKEDINQRRVVEHIQFEESKSGGESLRLRLQENRENELRSETSLIDTLQKNIMKETNQTTLTQHNQQPKQTKEKLQTIKEKSNESIASHKTVGSNKQINQQQKQTQSSNQQMPAPKGHYEGLSMQQKKQLVLQQANNITNQLRQLKTVASQLQKQPPQTIQQPDLQRPRSEYSQVSQLSNNIFTTLQTNNNQILQKISPTISKPMIESNIPSFKYVKESENQYIRQESNIGQNSVHMIDSSAFSFSDNGTHLPLVDVRPVARSNYVGLSNEQYERSGSREKMRSNGSVMGFNNQMYPQQVETVKYVYNPYGNIPLQRQQNPSIHFPHNESNRSMSQSFRQAPPLIHNNSATSIMRNALNQQVQDNHNRSNRIRFDNSKYSHLKQVQPVVQPARSAMNIPMNIQESQVNPGYNYSMGMNKSGGGVVKKKGINMLSPNPRPYLHR